MYPIADAPLTGGPNDRHSGMNMAYRAGKLFKQWVEQSPEHQFPKVIVTSPLMRAMQSADQFMRGAGLSPLSGDVRVVLDPRTREVQGGPEDYGTAQSRWNPRDFAQDKDRNVALWQDFCRDYRSAQENDPRNLRTQWLDDAEWNVRNFECISDFDWLRSTTWASSQEAQYWEDSCSAVSDEAKEAIEAGRPDAAEAVKQIMVELEGEGPIMIFTHSQWIDQVTADARLNKRGRVDPQLVHSYMGDDMQSKTAMALNKGPGYFGDKNGYNQASAVLQVYPDGSRTSRTGLQTRAVWDPRDLVQHTEEGEARVLRSPSSRRLWRGAFPAERDAAVCEEEHGPAQRRAACEAAATWQWMDDNREWQDYGIDVSGSLERAFQRRRGRVGGFEEYFSITGATMYDPTPKTREYKVVSRDADFVQLRLNAADGSMGEHRVRRYTL